MQPQARRGFGDVLQQSLLHGADSDDDTQNLRKFSLMLFTTKT